MIKSVLKYVQDCLSSMDSDEVADITQTVEAQQIADLLADTYFEFVNRDEWPWMGKGIKPTSLANILTPTVFTIPSDVKTLDLLRYNIDETGTTPNLVKLEWEDPQCFLEKRRNGNLTSGQPVTQGDNLYWVLKDRMPSVWTSFDDVTITCDAFKQTVETTLTTARLYGYGSVIPAFSVSNAFIPTLPQHLVPMLQAELNSAAHALLKQQDAPSETKKVFRQTAQSRRRPGKTVGQKQYYANQFGRRS